MDLIDMVDRIDLVEPVLTSPGPVTMAPPITATLIADANVVSAAGPSARRRARSRPVDDCSARCEEKARRARAAYRTLGLPNGSSWEDIALSYRESVRAIVDDAPKGRSSAQLMAELNDAYTILKRAHRR